MTDLAQLRALLAKMTPGEWRASDVSDGVQIYNSAFTYVGETRDLHGDDAAGIVALVNAAPALLASAARAAELEAEVSKLRGAISWIEPPFVDATTSHDELKKRVNFCVADAKRAALGEQP